MPNENFLVLKEFSVVYFWASRIAQIMFNLAVELTLNTLKQIHKLVSENWVLLSTKYKISIQITLLLSHIARMITIPEWGANIYFFLRHKMVMLPYLIPSVEEQKQAKISSPASL